MNNLTFTFHDQKGSLSKPDQFLEIAKSFTSKDRQGKYVGSKVLSEFIDGIVNHGPELIASPPESGIFQLPQTKRTALQVE